MWFIVTFCGRWRSRCKNPQAEQIEPCSTVATALNQLEPIDGAFDRARRMNSQLRPISWMAMVFLPLPIPSILCQVSIFLFLRSASLGVSHACFFTTR
jgi:hypothetical protein